MVQRHAIVVGGGIGGLTAAIGLRRAGLRVTVLERAAAYAETGAGITLWPNALRALDELDLGPALAPVTRSPGSGGLRNPSGRWLTRWDAADFERRLGRPMVGIHRAQLLDLLVGALPPDTVRWGVSVSEVTADGTVRTATGRERADVVIGADGINSVVRGRLWPGYPGPARVGAVAYRAVLDASQLAEVGSGVEIGETWGSGAEFGAVPLTDGRLYWFAALNTLNYVDNTDAKGVLATRFATWHRPVPELIAATPSEAILRHDLGMLARPLPSYVAGDVALLGDAAHAMPPYLGQGGCQAIEDAEVLAAEVARSGSVRDALAGYDRLRRRRTQSFVRASRFMGRLGPLLSNRAAVALRDTVIRSLPAATSVRGAASVADWTPSVIDGVEAE